IAQSYSPEDDQRHIEALLPAFRDPRYLRVDERPVFLVYRASHLPDPARTVTTWRAAAQAAGLPGLYLCCVESQPVEQNLVPRAGFDAAVEFAPDWGALPPAARRTRPWRIAARLGITNPEYLRHSIYDYTGLRDRMLAKP